jgi:hypothetical protein
METIHEHASMFRRFHLDGKVTLGELLTALAIVVSLFGLGHQLSQDRKQRTSEQAARIRSAAAQTLAKLDRLEELWASEFKETQPLFVSVSQELEIHSPERARDTFWRGVDESRAKIKLTVLDEKIETSYVDLMGYDTRARDLFRKTLSDLDQHEEEMYGIFKSEGQREILSFKKAGGYTSGDLGNKLRDTAGEVQLSYAQVATTAICPLQNYLVSIITKSDDDLINRSQKPVALSREGCESLPPTG